MKLNAVTQARPHFSGTVRIPLRQPGRSGISVVDSFLSDPMPGDSWKGDCRSITGGNDHQGLQNHIKIDFDDTDIGGRSMGNLIAGLSRVGMNFLVEGKLSSDKTAPNLFPGEKEEPAKVSPISFPFSQN